MPRKLPPSGTEGFLESLYRTAVHQNTGTPEPIRLPDTSTRSRDEAEIYKKAQFLEEEGRKQDNQKQREGSCWELNSTTTKIKT